MLPGETEQRDCYAKGSYAKVVALIDCLQPLEAVSVHLWAARLDNLQHLFGRDTEMLCEPVAVIRVKHSLIKAWRGAHCPECGHSLFERGTHNAALAITSAMLPALPRSTAHDAK
ncbi:hypothetical protein CEV33_2932 [Brucella grignonensis]|uniref:Transposase n=1 Tax=Brucella grignonensis TaxID=94627 RepID=A0A256F346_9HYPH|nr:hypothetical protein CEV33_2932 [Brucella grignonensis]